MDDANYCYIYKSGGPHATHKCKDGRPICGTRLDPDCLVVTGEVMKPYCRRCFRHEFKTNKLPKNGRPNDRLAAI